MGWEASHNGCAEFRQTQGGAPQAVLAGPFLHKLSVFRNSNFKRGKLIHELPKEIKKAAALGDLSENAEYHMAKQRQVFVNARLGQLKKRMGELAMVNLENIPRNKVGFGSTVVVFDTTKDEEITYKLVTSEESDVSKGLISTTSPIGRSLIGKQVGDTATVVTPNGKRELEILKLITIHDEVGA